MVWKTNECHKYIDYGLQINKICENMYIIADKYSQASLSLLRNNYVLDWFILNEF